VGENWRTGGSESETSRLRMSVSRDTFLTSREEEKNATASQMCARLFMSNAQRYVCTAWECAENKKRRGEKERERGESIDVKNKTTRCERIDEPALLKRACIRAVPKWQKKKKKKKKRRAKESSSSRRATARSFEPDEYKITFHSFIRASLSLSFVRRSSPLHSWSGRETRAQKNRRASRINKTSSKCLAKYANAKIASNAITDVTQDGEKKSFDTEAD